MKKLTTTGFIAVILFCLSAGAAKAQDDTALTAAEMDEYREKVRQLVSFLEFALNTLGDGETPTREKEIIVNQSYLKVFRDGEVQVEDDLDENRDVVTNKDIQAYLKDVDFFFKDVAIEFNIQEIQQLVNEQGNIFFKVSLNRLLNGVTVDNDTVRSMKQRFIEINLDPKEQDLKIASIYTTRLSEKEELENWWENLSYEWKAVYKREIGAIDSVDFSMIRQITRIENIDISNNKYIDDLQGIGKLTELKSLNISNTVVGDLTPLRNLTKLERLDCSATNVNSLDPLRYLISLKELYCNVTTVADIGGLANLQDLEILHLAQTQVNDIAPVENLKKLRELDISGTRVSDISPVANLTELISLDFSETYATTLEPVNALAKLEKIALAGTQVRNLDPLRKLNKLKVVMCNSAPVNSLEPLSDLDSLEKVYCDNTLITRAQANQFMAAKPETLVVFKSDLLKSWWDGLSESWKQIFHEQAGVKEEPDKDDLAKIARMTSLDLSGREIVNLEPLKILENLKSLSCANTGVSDLSPLREMDRLEIIDCSGNPVTSLEPLSFVRGVKSLNIEKTNVDDLDPLRYHNNLERLYCDDTPVSAARISAFKEQHPATLVIHKTDSLSDWWSELSNEWKSVFLTRLESSNAALSFAGADAAETGAAHTPGKEELHLIVSMKGLSIQNNYGLKDIEPLRQLTSLKNLQIVNSRISDLEPLRGLSELERVDLSNNPIHDISPLSGLKNIAYLNISNTPVDELDPISGLLNLRELDCAGTQIRSLSAVEDLYQLEFLDFSNTRVRNINPLKGLDNLGELVCFNTRVSSRRLEKLQEERNELSVKFY